MFFKSCYHELIVRSILFSQFYSLISRNFIRVSFIRESGLFNAHMCDSQVLIFKYRFFKRQTLMRKEKRTHISCEKKHKHNLLNIEGFFTKIVLTSFIKKCRDQALSSGNYLLYIYS